MDTITKYGGQVVVYVVTLAMAGVLAFQMIKGLPLNDLAVGIVLASAGIVSHGNGVQQGVNQTNDTVNKVSAAMPEASKGATGATGAAGPIGPAGPVAKNDTPVSI